MKTTTLIKLIVILALLLVDLECRKLCNVKRGEENRIYMECTLTKRATRSKKVKTRRGFRQKIYKFKSTIKCTDHSTKWTEQTNILKELPTLFKLNCTESRFLNGCSFNTNPNNSSQLRITYKCCGFQIKGTKR